MTFCLDAKIIKPVGENINNAVILLHGYGGDGNDIAALTINWKRFLPNTLFICPNGPEKCSINPMGYEWFDLNTEDEKYITEKALESEKILKKFIEECQELVQAKDENDKLEELADIFELMHAFLNLKNISISQLDELRKQKSTKRGGFSNKVFLIDVED